MSSSRHQPSKQNRPNTKVGANRPPTLADVRALKKRMDNRTDQSPEPRKAQDAISMGEGSAPVASGLHEGDSDDSFTYMGNRGLLRLATIAYREELDGESVMSDTASQHSEFVSQGHSTVDPEFGDSQAATTKSSACPSAPQSGSSLIGANVTGLPSPAPSAEVQQDAQFIATVRPAPSTTIATTLTTLTPPVALYLVMMPQDQVAAFLETTVGDNVCSIKAVDSLRSLVMYSDNPAHFDEFGSVITVAIRRQSRRFSLDQSELLPPHAEAPQLLPRSNQPPLAVKISVLFVLTVLALALTAYVGRFMSAVWTAFAVDSNDVLLGMAFLTQCCRLVAQKARSKIMESLSRAIQWAVLHPGMQFIGAIQRTRSSAGRLVQWQARALVELMLILLVRIRDMIALEATGLTISAAAGEL